MAERGMAAHAALEGMGGAAIRATGPGCGDNLAVDDSDAIDQARAVLAYLPCTLTEDPPQYQPVPPVRELTADMVPVTDTQGYDMQDAIDALVDGESFFEV